MIGRWEVEISLLEVEAQTRESCVTPVDEPFSCTHMSVSCSSTITMNAVLVEKLMLGSFVMKQETSSVPSHLTQFLTNQP